jgi:hypothetical protein
MEGYSVSMLAVRTGISEGKLKMILSRTPELKEMPYSVKNGKNRIFFDTFVNWLKDYEGVTKVTKVTDSVTNATNGKLPAGVQIRAMMSLYGSEEARKRIDFVLGYKTQPAVPVYPYRIEESKTKARLSKAAYAVEKKEQQKVNDKAWQDAHTGRLF